MPNQGSVLDAIGNTPMVELRRIAPRGGARVVEVLPVTTEEAKNMARRLAGEEAIFAGTSTGANVVGALRVAERLGPDDVVATIAVDSGLRYLSRTCFAAPDRLPPQRFSSAVDAGRATSCTFDARR